MSYFGLVPNTANFVVDRLSGDGSTVTFPLSRAPASVNAVGVTIFGLGQDTNTYTVAGGNITFTSPPPLGFENIQVRHLGIRVEISQPADGSVAQSQIAQATYSALKSGRKNKVINGGFDVWQRGTSHSSGAYGSDDRWRLSRVGSTFVNSQQTFALGQTGVPGNPRYYCQVNVTSVVGAGNYVQKLHRIEGVKSFAGETVTLSFYAKADATKNMSIDFRQDFGTGGSPSPDVVAIGPKKFNLTTSWQRFTTTVAIPSITGKTIGSDDNDYLELTLWFDAGTNWNTRSETLGHQSGIFDISNVQIEEGNVATDFEVLNPGETLGMCLRYYQKGTGIETGFYGDVTNANAYVYYKDFPAVMRGVPTMALNETSASNFPAVDSTLVNTSIYGYQAQRTANGTGVGKFTDDWEADAEL